MLTDMDKILNIKLINGRGQLGTALKNLIDKEKPTLEAIIHHTWEWVDRSEETQKKYYEDFKELVDKNPDSKIIFVSTTSKANNNYVLYKQISEKYL
jgi:hypothetical protein